MNKPLEGRWPRRKRDLGIAIWVSFLAASAGTFVLFGLVDPADVQSPWIERFDIGRKLAYSLGFGFLFAVSLLASLLTVFMIRSGPRRGHARGKGERRPPEVHDPSENNPDVDFEDIK